MNHNPDTSLCSGDQLLRSGFGRFVLAFSLLLLFCMPRHAWAKAPSASGHDKRPVTVADCITMTRLGNGLYEAGISKGNIAEWSPDGKRFTVVFKKGNIEHDTVDYSLMLFDTDAPPTNPPETLVIMPSSSNRPGISEVKWIGNDNIAFLGERPEETQRVYAINIATKTLKTLVNWQTNIVAFDVSPDLEETVFIAEKSEQEFPVNGMSQNGIVVSGQPLPDLLGISDGPSVVASLS